MLCHQGLLTPFYVIVTYTILTSLASPASILASGFSLRPPQILLMDKITNIIARSSRRISTTNSIYTFSTLQSKLTCVPLQNQTKELHHRDNFSRLFSTQSKSNENTSIYTPPDPERLAQLIPGMDEKTGRKYTLYEKCVRRLYITNLFHPVKLGLQNMEELHAALGNPMNKSNVTVIHIAGTNGKGSVALKVAKTLELAGYNVGLFVSPHIASFRERMQVNSVPISEAEVETLLPQIYDICEKGEIPATFFEVTTALAFSFFQKRCADVVVLETGLGGRLDATNVISSPALCVITSIGLEHTRILGDTIALIAKEKAGIMKPGSPVLVGPDVPHKVMKECAIEKGTDEYYSSDDFFGEAKIDEKWTNISSENGIDFIDYDLQNAQIARAALKLLESTKKYSKNTISLTDEIIEEGIMHRPPCRFEEIKVETENDGTNNQNVLVILDVAHNPAAMVHLVSKLEHTYPGRKKRIVVGFSADKDLVQCGSALLAISQDPSSFHLVEAAHPRAAKLEDILNAEPKLRQSNFDVKDRSITAQVKLALKLAHERKEILVVCGSVFLMAEAREAIGIDEPRDSDYIAEVAGANLRHGQEFFGNSDPEKK